MTPRSQSSPSVEQTGSPGSDEDEERPTHTSEIGTLKKLPNHGTAWLGSSSGVYFVNTVRRAFSAAFTTTTNVPASEDILTGEDAEGRSYNGPVVEGPSTTDGFSHLLSSALGRPPDRKIAVQLVTNFFQKWHPLFPFLHGPSFIKDMEFIYQQQRPVPPTFSGKGNAQKPEGNVDLRKIITFQLIINVASLDRTDIQLPVESRIKSTADVTRVAGSMSVNHDLETLQTLLAAQLYLVATLAIRQASTVGGMIIKLIYHAGLHRCPLRYAQLSLEDCEIRKRIFWSAYLLDRHCSLSLGDPNTIQDDDIDVCLSGKELHKAVARDLLANPEQEINLHMPAPRTGMASGPPSDDPRIVAESTGPEARQKQLREAALISFVHWSRLTGRIIEIFHKSINHRFPKHEQIIYLTSDIETWWNELPGYLTGDEAESEAAPHLQHLASFFKILYHRLLLLLNRPRLSLDQSSPEFQHGLQVCIRASRNIIAGLKSHKTHNQSMFLPGLLSASWMSGLIIAFACQLGKYPKARACADINASIAILESMNARWYTVKNCQKVLSLLLANIQSRKASTNGLLAVIKSDQASPSSTNDPTESIGRPPKRRRTNAEDLNASPRKDSFVDEGRSSTGSPIPSIGTTGVPSLLKQTSSAWSGSVLEPPLRTGSSSSESISFRPTFTPKQPAPSSVPMQSTSNPNYINPGLGSAVYATPQEMAFAQSNMALPELPGNGSTDDPMFWGNIDYNLADIFGSATWENLTGPFAPGWDTNFAGG